MPPRLAQKLLAGRFQPVGRREVYAEFGEPAFVAKQLREAVLIAADEVAEVLFERGGQSLDLVTDFPCLAPPFSRFWIEAQIAPNQRWGVLFSTEPVTSELRSLDLYRDARWILQGVLYMEGNRQVIGPASCMVISIGADGAYLGRAIDEPPIKAGHVSEEQYYLFALLAISFMHCKNVHAIEHDLVDAVTPKRERHPTRNKGLRYYTLEIDPMREVLRKEGRSDEVGLKQALHLCRGHFKDYRQSGLFGKIKGLFWWDAHARGTRDAGVVIKDYVVKGDGSGEEGQ